MVLMSLVNTTNLYDNFESNVKNIDIDKPRYDQSTFIGRLKHFAAITDMRKSLVSSQQLEDAKTLVEKHRFVLCFDVAAILMLTGLGLVYLLIF